MNPAYTTQLVCRAEDENGDMTMGRGEAELLTGTQAMAQMLKTRLGVCEDEWWEGDDGAIPWHTEVLGTMIRQGRQEEIDLMVLNRIRDTVGVIDVTGIESSIVNRQYRFSCTVRTVYGEVQASVES